MNNLVFVNHINLFALDSNLLNSGQFNEYLNLYRGWVKPGVEYICPRDKPFEFNIPFDCLPTQYPLPDPPFNNLNFDSIFDQLGETIVKKLNGGKEIYLLWSGGIDSTIIATSILKNLGPQIPENLYLVLNQESIDENPVFFYKFLQPFNVIQYSDFCNLNLDTNNSLVLTGEGGDQIFGHSVGNRILSQDPDLAASPWRNNVNALKHFFDNPNVPGFWDLFYSIMNSSITTAQARIETVYDFTWWLNYNFKFDSVMYRTPLTLFPKLDAQQRAEYYGKVVWNVFAELPVQQWSISAGSEEKIGKTKKSFKYAGKRYIYNFDRNEHYFREKRKEWSLPASLSPIIALDKNFQTYSYSNRWVRKTIHQIFNPVCK